MNSPDIELLKEIPGFKAIVRAVLRSQMQYLAQQLSDHGDVETIILAASMPDGSLSHIASHGGRGFLDQRDDIKSQFLSHCLTSKYTEGLPHQIKQEEYLSRNSSPRRNQRKTHCTTKKQESPLNHQKELQHHQQQNQYQQYVPQHQTYLDQNSSKDNSGTSTVECHREKETFKHATKTQQNEIPGTSYEGQMKDSLNGELYIRIESVSSGGFYNTRSLDERDIETEHNAVNLETSVDLTLEVSDVESDTHYEDHENSGDKNFNEVVIRDFEHIKRKKFSEGNAMESYDPIQNEVVIDELEHMKRKTFSESNNFEDYEQGQNEVVIEFGEEGESSGLDHLEMGTYMNNSIANVTEEESTTNHQKYGSGKCPTCSFCGTKFTSKSSYNRHVRKHTGENPWKCSECGKGFYRKDDLNTHVLKHSGQKPYQCVLCGLGFFKKTDVQLHMAKIHKTQSLGIRSNLPRAQKRPYGTESSPSG